MIDLRDALVRLGIEVTEVSPVRLEGRCPSGTHPDKNPSWSVMTDRGRHGLHFCQSCKFGGSFVDLVMHVLDIGYPAAREWLSALGDDSAERVPPTEVVFEVLSARRPEFRLPSDVVFAEFGKWPASIRSYVLSRGIAPEQVLRWQLGYAVTGRLAGRVVFVTRDGNGRPANYAARAVVDDIKKRYINAHSREHPDLSIFFGEDKWPGLDAPRTCVVVTEGAINGLAVERVFPGPLAGLSGSNVTASHISKLATFDMVIVATDNDKAGLAAAELIESGLDRTDTATMRLDLPKGVDAQKMEPEVLEDRLCHALAILRGCRATRTARS